MNLTRLPNGDRLQELLADRALWGLSRDEQAELDSLRLLADEPVDESFDYAVAAVALAGVSEASVDAMPPSVRHSLLQVAGGTLGSESRSRREAPPRRAHRAAAPRRSSRVAWGLMAAAAAVVALFAVLPDSAPDAASLRQRLLAAEDAVVVEWSATDHPRGQGVWGDVVWSDSRQEGYMRFAGLASNDPSREQYQLWVFDPRRDDRYPVDGGVFDVTESGEVIVPISTKLEVQDPSLFALTIEPPGGVVVSSREDLFLVASLQ